MPKSDSEVYIYKKIPLCQFIIEMFKARQYLTNQGQYEESQCCICYQHFSRMARCKGPCHKVICLRCITRLVCEPNPRCPMKCCDKFDFKLVEFPNLTFVCPFKSLGCNFKTNTQKTWKNHTFNCWNMTQDFRISLQRRSKYQCPKGHGLNGFKRSDFSNYFKWKEGQYSFFSKQCASCSTVTYSFTICMECTLQTKKFTFFCAQCCTIPATKTQCPHGDILQIINLEKEYGYNWICDVCGLSALINGKTAYYQRVCRYGCCQSCHTDMKYANKLVPMQWFYDFKKNKPKM